ncbi:hypothetical protein Tco_0147958, partial [Tanacetum coccineum]
FVGNPNISEYLLFSFILKPYNTATKRQSNHLHLNNIDQLLLSLSSSNLLAAEACIHVNLLLSARFLVSTYCNIKLASVLQDSPVKMNLLHHRTSSHMNLYRNETCNLYISKRS